MKQKYFYNYYKCYVLYVLSLLEMAKKFAILLPERSSKSSSLTIIFFIGSKQKQCESFVTFFSKHRFNISPPNHTPAGKYWSPERPEDIPIQDTQDVPYRPYLTIPGTSQSDVLGTLRNDVQETS